MQEHVFNSFSISNATVILCKEMQTLGFKAWGLFDSDNKLVGFISGHNDIIYKNMFTVTGIYCIIPIRVKEFINYVEMELKQLGYMGWTTDVVNNGKKTIVPKLGATVLFTRYKKEF
ncbi:hypothetical protein [Sulfurimonas sp.]|uniref:hypothetical protein n=1 Tax=Sulfurimonas sp. TaxID=2022749 RepID=UPI003D0EFEA8